MKKSGKRRTSSPEEPPQQPSPVVPSRSSLRVKRNKKSSEEEASAVHIETSPVESPPPPSAGSSRSRVQAKRSRKSSSDDDVPPRFLGDPVPAAEAKVRWPKRFEKVEVELKPKPKAKTQQQQQQKERKRARRHYLKAEVDGKEYSLYDDVYAKGLKDKPDYIAKIVELFEGSDKNLYFTAQWYYRPVDTLIEERVHSELKHLFDDKRVFYSDITDDNPLDCIVSKINIVQVSAHIDSSELPQCDFYCDMGHSLSYSTISNLPQGLLDRSRNPHESSSTASGDSSSTISSEASCSARPKDLKSGVEKCDSLLNKPTMKLLDLYAGCGGMSTGLCLGTAIADVNLMTKWAVDMNEHACKSLKFNHPETEVRNESAEDFLMLLKEWKELCKKYCSENTNSESLGVELDVEADEDTDESEEPSDEIFEVEKLIDICFGDPNKKNEKGLYFKVQWKGYDSSHDTWEPSANLSDCPERVKEFVVEGHKANILPLPGDVDVICGGPPCQGVSGYNRFRDTINPLEDEKNKQLVVFMDIVEYLRPKYVLMENVTDLLKFLDGYCGRYAIGRLIAMKYQTRLGLLAAGSYGLPQYRMRAFFWGACPTQNLPQFPLPTHETIPHHGVSKFLDNLVYDDVPDSSQLKAPLTLEDILTDLPLIENDESRDEMAYEAPPQTEFQKQIRLLKDELLCSTSIDKKNSQKAVLYDHLPLKLNTDDYARVCRIPKEKGANFRRLPGVLVGDDNVVYLDPSVERELLPSGNPLVPDYAITYVGGKSPKPFGRLWWDEIVTTVVTRAEPHNQRFLHPVQDRVLSIRENARIQGFPDYYRFFGPVKQRYIQVGNAVAVPVARALGYALAKAIRGESTVEPLLTLPPDFPNCPRSSG